MSPLWSHLSFTRLCENDDGFRRDARATHDAARECAWNVCSRYPEVRLPRGSLTGDNS